MLAIYTLVFSTVFKVRIEPGNSFNDDRFAFAMTLFAGLIFYNFFSECLARAPGLIVANTNYVKKVIFPLEILPWATAISALFHASTSFIILMLFLLVTGYPLHWTLIYLPIVALPFIMLTLGLSWFLASVGVFVRDIGQFIGLVLTALLFMSPIFYPVSALPETLRDYLLLNPLTFIIEQARAVLLYGQAPDWPGLLIYYAIALLTAYGGFLWFEKTRKGFADVL